MNCHREGGEGASEASETSAFLPTDLQLLKEKENDLWRKLLYLSFPFSLLPSFLTAFLPISSHPSKKKKKRTILSRFLSLLLLYNLVCWWYTLISFHITSCSGCFWVGQWIYSIFRAGRFFFGRRSLEHGMEEPVVVNREDNLVDLPPGFRFHPTDEEIITHYLAAKAADGSFTASAIGEVDLNKCEPWDMPSMLSLSLKPRFPFP